MLAAKSMWGREGCPWRRWPVKCTAATLIATAPRTPVYIQCSHLPRLPLLQAGRADALHGRGGPVQGDL